MPDFSVKPYPQGTGQAATPSPADDQSRLDDAMRRTDDLLVQSLMRDEQRRKNRRVRILLGGFAMIALFATLSLFLLQSHHKPSQLGAAQNVVTLANSADSPDAATYTQKGWDLWRSQQYDAAAESFHTALRMNIRLVDAWNGLGWADFNLGKVDAALTAFQRAIDLEPNYPAALNGMGQSYFAKNDLSNAEKYLLKAAPSAAASWYGLAKIYLLQSKWDDAQKYLQKIINSGDAKGSDLDQVKFMLDAAKNKNLPDSLKKQISPAYGSSPVAQTVQQGWAAMNRGDLTKARQLFAQALHDYPNDANALNGMGWCLLRTGDMDGAMNRFQAALKNDPDAAGSMNGMAIIDRNRGKLDDAIAIWEQMQAKFSGVNAATYGLADGYMTKGQYDKAVKMYQQIVDANPNDADAKAKLDAAKQAAANNK
jgi:superkiller protein 3